MEFGIVKGDVVLHKANKYEATAVGDVGECTIHRIYIASGVKDGCWEVATKCVAKFAFDIFEVGYAVGDVEVCTTEVEPFFVEFKNGDVDTRYLGKLDDREANRPCADDEDVFVWGKLCAIDSMTANAQGFY